MSADNYWYIFSAPGGEKFQVVMRSASAEYPDDGPTPEEWEKAQRKDGYTEEELEVFLDFPDNYTEYGDSWSSSAIELQKQIEAGKIKQAYDKAYEDGYKQALLDCGYKE